MKLRINEYSKIITDEKYVHIPNLWALYGPTEDIKEFPISSIINSFKKISDNWK